MTARDPLRHALRDPRPRLRRDPRRRLLRGRDERGSAPAEFVMVGALLTVLTLAVIQLALALFVGNTVLDSAAEGARIAALADNGLFDGRARTRDLIASTVGSQYASQIDVEYGSYLGAPAVTVTVRATLPLIGLFGLERGLEVHGHAAVETLDGSASPR